MRSTEWVRRLRLLTPDTRREDAIDLSVVVPVYGNRGTLPTLIERVTRMAQTSAAEVELVFVVDGSPDDSLEVLLAELPGCPLRCQVLAHTRNFGSFAAVRTGLAAANGDVIGVMAADLQEPPELMEDFFRALAGGEYDVAVGRRTGRDDPAVTTMLSGTFWWLYRKVVNRDIPRGGVDVFACTRPVAVRLVDLHESHSSLVALLFWVGFRRCEIPYQRQAREDGVRSGWTLRKRATYLSDSVFAFTRIPIHAITLLGVAGTVVTATVAMVVLGYWLTGHIHSPGYTPLMLAILLSTFLLLTGMGVLGSYVWRTYENTKGRPHALTRAHWVNTGGPAMTQTDEETEVVTRRALP